jgi:cytochrome c-type biogenesis protein CcmH
LKRFVLAIFAALLLGSGQAREAQPVAADEGVERRLVALAVELRCLVCQNESRRYGDFVLYRPPFKESTLLLWAGPFLLLVAGAAGAAIFLRRRRARRQAALSAEDEAHAEALLSEDPRA